MGSAVSLQWLKMRKSEAFPHVARWFDHLEQEPVLREISEKYCLRPRRPQLDSSKEAVPGTAKSTQGEVVSLSLPWHFLH